MTLLIISNMHKTFYFCGSLIRKSCQITTIRNGQFEFERLSFFYTHCIIDIDQIFIINASSIARMLNRRA